MFTNNLTSRINGITTHTHTQVMCNLINTHTHTHTRTHRERVGSVAANPDNLGSNKEAGGEHKVLRAQVRFVQVERVCPFCRV